MTDPEISFPTVVFQNQPATHRQAVCLFQDKKFLPNCLFLANKIACAHPNRDFDICIVAGTSIVPHPLFATLAIRLVQLDISAAERQLKIKGRIGFATYLRIFMPHLWIDDYDQLLYLDGDVSYQRGDIASLLKQSSNDAQHASIPDVFDWERQSKTIKDFSRDGEPQQLNLNASVLIIDVKSFVRDGFSTAVRQLM